MNYNTKEYYELNASNFIEGTVNCDMSLQYNMLLKHLIKGSTILDVGFGSARDMLKFKELGFNVCGIDVTHKFVENALSLGLDVEEKSVLDINYKDSVDAVWACASLLHLTKAELPVALTKLYDALTDDGYMYMSFKLGEFSGERNGRYFTDLTLDNLNELLKDTKFILVETMITKDVRPDREESWLNVVVKK